MRLLVILAVLVMGCGTEQRFEGTEQASIEPDYEGYLLQDAAELNLMLVVVDENSRIALSLSDAEGGLRPVQLQFIGEAYFRGHKDTPIEGFVTDILMQVTDSETLDGTAQEDGIRLIVGVQLNEPQSVRLRLDLHIDADPPRPSVDLLVGTLELASVD